MEENGKKARSNPTKTGKCNVGALAEAARNGTLHYLEGKEAQYMAK
jgi:hypothetical protein